MKSPRADEYILEMYPQPLARAWEAVLQAPRGAERVRLLFDGALRTIGRFVAAILLAERLGRPNAEAVSDLLRELRNSPDPLRATWKTVWHLLRDPERRSPGAFFSGVQLWGGAESSEEFFATIEHLCARATSLRTGVGEFSERVQQETFDACLPRVRAVLNHLDWLLAWPMVEVAAWADPDDATYEATFRIYRGVDEPTERRAACQVKLVTGRVYLHRHDGSLLDLWPWVQADPAAPPRAERIALFDIVDGRGRIVCTPWDPSRPASVERPTLTQVLRAPPRRPLKGPPIHELHGHRFDPGARFKIVGRIGQGGMGVVERAIDDDLPREVALKHMLPWVAAVPRFSRRFAEEAEIQSKLRHTNIMNIEVFRTTMGEPFIVMERCGETLADRVRALVAEAVEVRCRIALELAERLLDALQYLHDKGYAHLDIKPSNVLFGSDGVPMLADFGLARRTSHGEVVVPTDENGYTKFYAPSEQLAGRPCTASDVFALAVTLDEVVTGAPTKIAGEHVPEPLGRLLRSMARPVPSERLRASEAFARLRLLKGELPPSPVAPSLFEDLAAPLDEVVAARIGASLRRHLESGAPLPAEVIERLEMRRNDGFAPVGIWNALRRKHLATAWPHRRGATSLADLIEAGVGRWSPSALRDAAAELPLDAARAQAVSETPDDAIERAKNLPEVWRTIPVDTLRHESLLACMAPGAGVRLSEAAFVREALCVVGQPDVEGPVSRCWAALSALLANETYERRAQRKRGGGIRWIHVPTPRLRAVQSVFARMLARCLPASRWSVGFTPARSTALHARAHAGARAAVAVDIHDFFGSVRPLHVLPSAFLGYDPARLELDLGAEGPMNPLAGWSEHGLLFIVDKLFIGHETRESLFLPQGAPSSPVLANLAGALLDTHIARQIARGAPDGSEWSYSRYADDLVISSRSGGHEFHEAAERMLTDAIETAAWTVSPAKVRHWSSLRGAALVLCGIVVPGTRDGDLTLPREAARTARAAFHRARKGDVTRVIRGTLAYAYAITGRHALVAALPGSVQKQVRVLARLLAPKHTDAFVEGWLSRDGDAKK
jgi:serine/threonine protein kinase